MAAMDIKPKPTHNRKKSFKKTVTSRKKPNSMMEEVVCQILPALEQKESLGSLEIDIEDKTEEGNMMKKDEDVGNGCSMAQEILNFVDCLISAPNSLRKMARGAAISTSRTRRFWRSWTT